MRWPILLFIFASLLAPIIGCGGGLTQADLKRSGIKRPKDDETPPIVKKDPKQAAQPVEEMPQSSSIDLAENKPTRTDTQPSARDTLSTDPATSATTTDSSPTEVDQSTSENLFSNPPTDGFPTETLPAAQVDSRPSNSERRPTRRAEQEAEEARLAAIAREARKAKIAKRRTVDRAEAQGTVSGNTPRKPSDAASATDLIENLFERLVNPENFVPEEFHQVARELALAGASTEALAYYYAWATTTKDASDWVEQAAWSSGLRRPVGALHVGIGIEYTGPPQLLSKASPIGSQNKSFAGLSRGKSNNQLKKYTGELGDRLLIGLDERFAESKFGPLFVPDEIDKKRKRKVTLKWQAMPTGFNPESLGMGLTLLGGGKRKELLYISEVQCVDVLVIFDISLRQPRSGPLINISTVKLIDVRTGEELSSTAPLNNVRTAYARQDRTKADPVETEFTELFDYVDASLSLGPLPNTIRSTHATARVKELSADEYSNPLPILAEMRLYFVQGLIDETTLLEGYQSLLGTAAARTLVRGTVPEQVSIVAEYLPKIEPAKK